MSDRIREKAEEICADFGAYIMFLKKSENVGHASLKNLEDWIDNALREETKASLLDNPKIEECYYCGEYTYPVAGNPTLWPLHFPHKEDPGKVKAHHVKCVSSRLIYLEHIKELISQGWDVNFGQNKDEFRAYAFRGDLNCPYRQEYDPKTGHGYSQVWSPDDEEDIQFKSLEEAFLHLNIKCGKVIPGRQWKKLTEGKSNES